MGPRGVRLEQQKKASLKNEIESLPAPGDLPELKSFAPLKKDTGASGILSAASRAEIVDELDGAPLESKLRRFAARGAGLLLACAFDEDPYVSGASAVLRESASKAAFGLSLAARACGAEKIAVAVLSRGEAARLSKAVPGTASVVAGKRYPAKDILARRLRREGKKPEWIGVQACVALAEAVRRGRPQRETVVTVAGDGVRRWRNFRVKIGTPVGDVLRVAEPEENIPLVVIGSSVTGRTVRDLSLPVTAATRCVIALRRPPAERSFPCIGCGRCARACTEGILPWLALLQMESGAPDPARLFHVGACTGCGACGAVCPSGIDLEAAVRRAAAFKEGGDADGTA